jgi:peptide/nickel transport system permease protein
LTYFIRRLLQTIPALLILSIILFSLIRLTPGGPLAYLERNPDVPREQIQLLREKMGLDKPLPIQYLRWMEGILLHGDLGMSYKFHRPVTEMIFERIPNTFLLVGISFILTLIIAIPIGILSARKPYSFFDYVATTFSFMGQSIPVYWLGLMMIIIFYMTLKNPITGLPLLPVGSMHTTGKENDFWDTAVHFILPVVTLSLAWAAWYSRFLRASMLEVFHEDYIRTARAKGLPENSVVYHHGFRNAVIPLITLIALDLPSLFAGALFTETVFSWPGMGRLFWDAAKTRDYNVLLGVVIINAVLIMFCNLFADLLYGFLDPRVKYD